MVPLSRFLGDWLADWLVGRWCPNIKTIRVFGAKKAADIMNWVAAKIFFSGSPCVPASGGKTLGLRVFGAEKAADVMNWVAAGIFFRIPMGPSITRQDLRVTRVRCEQA